MVVDCCLPCATKPDIVMARPVVTRKLFTTMGSGQFLSRRVVAASSGPTNRSRSTVLTTVRWVVRIGSIGAAHPFPGVTGEVQYSIRARTGGETVHRGRFIPSRLVLRSSRIRRAIPPRKLPSIAAPCCLLPFRFRGQTLTQPAAVTEGAGPRDLHDRMILKSVIREPPSFLPVNPRIVIVNIIVSSALRTFRTHGLQEQSKLGIGHRSPIDGKLRELNPMSGPFVFGADVASHGKWTRRDGNHSIAPHLSRAYGPKKTKTNDLK